MKNFFKKIVKIALPLILLFFLLKTVIFNWQEVLPYLNNFQPVSLSLSFLILLLIYPESTFAWYVLIKKLGVKISLNSALYVWVVSNTSRYIPGTIWQYVGRIGLGRDMGIARKEGTLSILYETLLIIISGCLVSLFTLGWWSTVGVKLYMVFPAVVIPLVFLHPEVSKKVLHLLARLTKKEQITFAPLKIQDYLSILPLFLANFLLNGLALMLLTYAFTGNFKIENMFPFSGVYALSWLVGYFSLFAPGGIGVADSTLALLLSMQMPLPLASTIAIIYRFLLVIAESIVFIVVLNLRAERQARSMIE